MTGPDDTGAGGIRVARPLSAPEIVQFALLAGLDLLPDHAAALAPMLEELLRASELLPANQSAEAGWLGDPYDPSTGGPP